MSTPQTPPNLQLEVTSSPHQPIPKDDDKDIFHALRRAIAACKSYLLHYVPGLGLVRFWLPYVNGRRVPGREWDTLALIYEFLNPGCLCGATTGHYTPSRIIIVSNTSKQVSLRGKTVAACAANKCGFWMIHIDSYYTPEQSNDAHFRTLNRRSADSSSSSVPSTPSNSQSSPLAGRPTTAPARPFPFPLRLNSTQVPSSRTSGRTWQAGSSEAGSSSQAQPLSASQAGSSSQSQSASAPNGGSRIGADVLRKVARGKRRQQCAPTQPLMRPRRQSTPPVIVEREPTPPLVRARRRFPFPAPSDAAQGDVRPFPFSMTPPGAQVAAQPFPFSTNLITQGPPSISERPTTATGKLLALSGIHHDSGLYPHEFEGLLMQCENCGIVCTHDTLRKYHRCLAKELRPQPPREVIEISDDEDADLHVAIANSLQDL
ncbi:hypothetical protein D9611_012304 [Ephemerocybe angulata]|uniref:Uncharacterized protein n=1 Tax=Ephemerocybe angulata TaxID=980116 RepID=A0A8H5ES81_9AGAR|nr:hypothetical protein D9611_012304 [Tulosesus angulatus]